MDGARGWFGLLPPGNGGVSEAGSAALRQTRVHCKTEGNGNACLCRDWRPRERLPAAPSNPQPLPPGWSLVSPGWCCLWGYNTSASIRCFVFKCRLFQQSRGCVEGCAVLSIWQVGFWGASERMKLSCSDNTLVFPRYLQSRTVLGGPLGFQWSYKSLLTHIKGAE